MSPANVEFGQRVRELRESKRRTDPAFSLRRFAQSVGISAAFLSKVEMGEALPPKAEKIKIMAELLGVNADELLALAGKVDPVLPQIIRERPNAMADFLRTANEELTDEQIKELTRRMREGDL
ncbi:MAG: helix-turn-helix domain-containing protein [Acidobacteria bacterium]|nr:helix-turn-helix domain-containing protein [Acidobacteriota bacterium]